MQGILHVSFFQLLFPQQLWPASWSGAASQNPRRERVYSGAWQAAHEICLPPCPMPSNSRKVFNFLYCKADFKIFYQISESEDFWSQDWFFGISIAQNWRYLTHWCTPAWSTAFPCCAKCRGLYPASFTVVFMGWLGLCFFFTPSQGGSWPVSPWEDPMSPACLLVPVTRIRDASPLFSCSVPCQKECNVTAAGLLFSEVLCSHTCG